MSTHPHYLWADLFRQRNPANSLVHEALRENVLFQTLTPKELAFLSTLVYERIYEPGEIVFRQNDHGMGMYVIARGMVAIRTQSPDQGEMEVARLEKGSFFGEISLIEKDNIRSATAIALEKAVLVGFFKPDLMEIVDRKPAMGVKILLQLTAVLSQRLIAMNDRLAELSTALRVERGGVGEVPKREHDENAAA
jgi:CRP/FNR family transcriptional regulator, cyclic AMP receptor protein